MVRMNRHTDDDEESARRRDYRIVARLFMSVAFVFLGQVGTIASGIWWAGKFEGTTITRIDYLEKATSTSNQLATNVAILNANVTNLSENVNRLRARIELLQSGEKRK